MKKRILIIASEFPPQPGGIGNHAYNLAKSLAEADYSVTVLSDQRSVDGLSENRFDKSLCFKVKRIKLHAFRPFMYIKRLISGGILITSHNTIIASGKFSLWLAAFFSLFSERNNIAIIHGTEVNLNNPLAKNLVDLSLFRFKSLIAVSNYTNGLIKAKFKSKVVVIPNGYDNDLWKPFASMASSVNSIYPKLITVGNVNYRKGQQNVIEKLAALSESYPELQYHCAGVPSKAAAFKELAATHNVLDRVHFHGILGEEDLIAQVQSSHIAVMLSTPYTKEDVEGFGIALIEANALGIPTIGSKHCGIEDAINDGNSGILIDYDSHAAFNNAVDKILTDYDRFSLEASKWAAIHKWDRIIKRYITIIES